jgi:hypothetical protein
MDIMAFTTSVENVLSAYLNRNAALEYHAGLVQLVAPVSVVEALMRGKTMAKGAPP